MNIKRSSIALLLISILSSCATLKPDKLIDEQIKLTKENVELINGVYSRASINQPENDQGDLFWNFFAEGYNVGVDSLCSVDLKIIDVRHLKVTILKNDSIIKSKILKGKLKYGYFEMNRRIFILPALFLNVFRTIKFRIGKLKNNYLTTDYKEILWGTGYFIIPFYRKEIENDYVYKRY